MRPAAVGTSSTGGKHLAYRANPTRPVKTGAGELVLSSTNTYTGATNVTAGTLEVDGSIGTSSLTTVSSGSSLVYAALTGTGSTGTTIFS
mgnify:CR=1 FL=1